MDVAIIVSAWLPDWAFNCVRPLVVIVFPPVSEEDDIEMPRRWPRGGPPEVTVTT